MLKNKEIGADFYAKCTDEERNWAHKQLLNWPDRVDERRTTNISFFYGVVTEYRKMYGSTPEMSSDYAECVKVLDRLHLQASSSDGATETPQEG